jgi:hypothetical protein
MCDTRGDDEFDELLGLLRAGVCQQRGSTRA